MWKNIEKNDIKMKVATNIMLPFVELRGRKRKPLTPSQLLSAIIIRDGDKVNRKKVGFRHRAHPI